MGGIVKTLMSVIGVTLGLALVPIAPSQAGTPTSAVPSPAGEPRQTSFNVCLDTDVTNALSTASPGDLLAQPQDLTLEAGLIEGRIYRVIYGTSAPAGTTQAACTIVAVPEGQTVSHLVLEGHGAWGLKQECLPSMSIRNFVQGTDATSQGAGPLFSTVKSNGAFIAPDYPAADVGGTRLMPFLHGVTQGVSMLDAARVVTGNATAFGLSAIAPDAELPLVVTGYSQGGGAALWAAQLAKHYLELQADRTLDLAGVLAYEPGGTQLVAASREPRALDGYHLADRVTYEGFAGTIYFSWLAQSWSEMSQANAGPLPFGPTPKISASAVLSKEGLTTAKEVVRYCSTMQLQLGLAAMKYRDPDKHRLLKAPFAGTKKDGKWQSAFDATCRRTKNLSASARTVCAWIRFNTLGPNGENPFPKLPTNNAGELTPVYLIHGRDDHTVWCVDDSGDVEPRNCVTAQYYESLEPAYCQGQGHLHVDYLAGFGHGSIYWPSMTNRETGGFYFGSPHEKFISGAVAGTLPKTCAINNVELR